MKYPPNHACIHYRYMICCKCVTHIFTAFPKLQNKRLRLLSLLVEQSSHVHGLGKAHQGACRMKAKRLGVSNIAECKATCGTVKPWPLQLAMALDPIGLVRLNRKRTALYQNLQTFPSKSSLFLITAGVTSACNGGKHIATKMGKPSWF